MYRSYSNQTKLFLTSGGIVVIALLVAWFVIMPLLTNVEDAIGNIQKNYQQLSRINEEIQSDQILASSLAKVGTLQDSLRQMFPAREEMVGLVQGLESALAQANLSGSLTITDPLAVANSRGRGAEPPATPVVAGLRRIQEISYTLEFSGTYRQLGDYFFNLQTLPYFSEVSKLSVTAETSQNEKLKILQNSGLGNAKLEGVFFIQQP